MLRVSDEGYALFNLVRRNAEQTRDGLAAQPCAMMRMEMETSAEYLPGTAKLIEGPVNAILRLQQRLESKAHPQTKVWWERYLKHVIPFRGVPMADIRAALHSWLKDEAAQRIPTHDDQKRLALSLIRETYAEDKLAGILLLQEVLLPAGGLTWQQDLPQFAGLFQDGAIADWSTCDWFCVRVLGPLAEGEGEPCARALAAWSSADKLWQRRASGVAFVNLAHKGDRNFPGFTTMLLEICATTVQSQERCAQTGTGWVLRELSRAEPERVVAFLEANARLFSAEGLRYAIEKLPAEAKARLIARRRGRPR